VNSYNNPFGKVPRAYSASFNSNETIQSFFYF